MAQVAFKVSSSMDTAGEATPATFNVLVIDDDPGNRRLLKAIFDAEGAHVALAEGCAAALRVFDSAKPDIVLLDLQMPGVDGLETLRRLRLLAARLPILILTSGHDVGAAVEATRLGADDFMTRPIQVETVRCAIRLRGGKVGGED